jgi:DNA-directed RNA polymerase specialized sigma subunit, sigma24 homolog
MQNYRDSDYALNKYSTGIVYRFADKIVEVTLDDYLAENPGASAEDFQRLKEISDADYLEQDRTDYRQTWKNSPMALLNESKQRLVPSPEETLISEQDALEARRKRTYRLKLAKKLLGRLTHVQRQRYYLHHIRGLSTRKIAEIEGVNQKSVHESLHAAQKKIDKYLDGD